ncbi:pyridoxal-phosphate dependent enzyme [Pedobacter sp. P351]|uniref:1-aminocyclopropane-1-carboxylate deaminase/D-cysteine desulfhydrase n=1 Tax=Pedobacter superstes TaxID=3133441 RepID=UPI0030AC91EE
MINLDFHSPEEEFHHPLFLEKKIRVYLKRDDLIHPFISGNKWRKLKYILRKAESEGKKHLVTFGGVWSNHLLATACAAAKFGLKSTGIVRGEDINTETLTFCRLFGMNLLFADRESYRDKQTLFDKHFKDDQTAFLIDEGGCSNEGAQGCAELIDELKQEYQHIFCSCGTGTTAAGIINGLKAINSNTVFHGISVLKGDFLKKEIGKLLLQPVEFSLHSDYHFGGYAKTQPELIQFIKDFASGTGVLLDPVYTGKMMFAIFDLAKKNYFLHGDKILAIHTGGLFGLLGMKEKFQNE